MHRCLYIQEIISIIFEYLDKKRDLVALATTCKTFRDPALQIVWSEIRSLAPLTRCLPSDIWYEGTCSSSGTTPPEQGGVLDGGVTMLSLAREPDQNTDWCRFKFYAPFIRSIDCALVCTPNRLIDVDILRVLGESGVEKPILPNLRSLVWRIQNGIDHYMDLFSGPRLTHLTIFFPNSPTSHPQTFACLTSSLSNLHSISVYTSARWHDLTSPLSDFVCGLRNLKEVSTNIQLDRRALRHLVTSPCTRLAIGNDATDILQSMIELGTTPFPEIGSLELQVTSRDGTSVAGLIELLSAKKLHSLSVRHVGWGARGLDITQLIKTISTRCSHTKLVSLFVSVIRRNLDQPVDHPFSTLAPLLVFRNVTHMGFFNVSFDLEDGDIENIAIAWPCLRNLNLSSAPHERRSRLTLASMVALVKHCLGLESFKFVIHITVVDFSLLPHEGSVIPNRIIQYILLDHSTTDHLVDPAEVAKFLSRLFPSLKGISGVTLEPEPDQPDNLQRFCREVSRHLQANQAHGVSV